MLREAIILAGGLGTRLRSEVKELPKSMAPIGDRPYLEYLFDFLISQGIQKLILSIGYKSEYIRDYFSNQYKEVSIEYVIEKSPLGTGGAIKKALTQATGEYVLVTNGDSIIKADVQKQYDEQVKANAVVSFALKKMHNFERYGRIQIDENNTIIQFEEKQAVEEGLINAGLYIFKTQPFEQLNFPDVFSIERDYFECYLKTHHFIGIPSSGYFLDIGIPADFAKAQYEIAIFPSINKTWTLFLDRDGVINKKIDGDYVRSIDQFELLAGVLEAIHSFSQYFGKIIVVTNQQGVGKGLMTELEVEAIHTHLKSVAQSAEARIDSIYFAPQLAEENSIMRKPNIGMSLKAKADYPEIDFSKSIMVGDSLSDMAFGKQAGMHCIFISQNNETNSDYYNCPTLHKFSNVLNSILT